MKWKNCAAVVCGLLLLVGCATPYQKEGFAGGFAEKQLSRNEFFVGFSGNGYTSGQRAVDMCMLRCAEICLGHGFRYYALTANNTEYDRSTAVTSGNFIPTGYGGGVFLSSTQVIPKPNTANRIVCFREKPPTIADYFDAQQVFQQLSQKYSVKREIQMFPQSSLDIRFKQISNFKCESPAAATSVVVFEDTRPAAFAIPVAEYADWESPSESDEELKKYLIAAAVNAGANGVHFLKHQSRVREFNPNADQRVGFICALLVVPKAKLGVEFETGSGYENRRVIRRIQNPDAQAAGLLIGDNVLSLNGIDIVRSAEASDRDWLKWKVGQVVQVTVAREGKEVILPIKVIANLP